MQIITDNIGSDLWFLPWTIFAIVLVIGGLVGFWTGWKTALYFSLWGILGLIVGVFTTKYAIAAFNWINVDMGGKTLNVGEIFGSLRPYIIPLLLIGYLFIAYFLGFIIYWIVRKPLKRYLKVNASKGKSNAGHRIIGAGVGILTALPSAVMMTNASQIVTKPKDGEMTFGKFNDSLVRALTFGQGDGFSKEIHNLDILFETFTGAKRDEIMNALQSVFDGSGVNITPDSIAPINSLLTSDIAPFIINSIAKNNSDLIPTIPADTTAPTKTEVEIKVGSLLGGKLNASSKVKDVVKDTINSIKPDAWTSAQVNEIIAGLFN